MKLIRRFCTAALLTAILAATVLGGDTMSCPAPAPGQSTVVTGAQPGALNPTSVTTGINGTNEVAVISVALDWLRIIGGAF